ncbi:hypothetical protein TcasGA2_TC032409 [Tribolium castaneum]|uniref:Uncharacterized protein n=1 Tax=Tribolium castaneum TaxID=7070 RepID=A0A139WLC9_TRICA|nr:hypothetical protein TcasGA2_TC032409 [Tribolium castaneum]
MYTENSYLFDGIDDSILKINNQTVHMNMRLVAEHMSQGCNSIDK